MQGHSLRRFSAIQVIPTQRQSSGLNCFRRPISACLNPPIPTKTRSLHQVQGSQVYFSPHFIMWLFSVQFLIISKGHSLKMLIFMGKKKCLLFFSDHPALEPTHQCLLLEVMTVTYLTEEKFKYMNTTKTRGK